MQKIIVMCGLPRSGKTTYAKEHFKDFVRVSMDDLIEMTTQVFKIEFGDLYNNLEKSAVKEIIKKGYNTVIDKTSLTKKSRRRLIGRILHIAETNRLPKPYFKLVVMTTPVEVCIERNIQTKKVPKGVFLEMIRSYEEPAIDEGWDEIIKF